MQSILAVILVVVASVASLPGFGEEWRSEDFAAAGAADPAAGRALPEGIEAGLEPEGFRLTDAGAKQGSLFTMTRSWHAEPNAGSACRATVKVLRCQGLAGVMIGFSDGVHEDLLTLHADRIELYRAGVSHAMDTTDAFHTYTVRVRAADVHVEVDGQPVISAPGAFTHPAHRGRNRFSFGSGSSGSQGDALWREVAWTNGLAGWREREPELPGAEHMTVFKEEGVYAPFPALRRDPANGDIYALFTKKARRTHHETVNSAPGVCRSRDGGRTWEPVDKAPGGLVGPRPGEVFEMADGVRVRIGQNWRRWFPPDRRAEFEGRYRIQTPGTYKPGWIAVTSGGWLARSDDGGATWTKTPIPELDAYVSCSSPWSYMQLRDGRVARAFHVRNGPEDSGDVAMAITEDGRDASVCRVMGDPDETLHFTEETLIHETTEGLLWLLTRVEKGDDQLWQAASRDGGQTWTARRTGIRGHPPSGLVELDDGRLVLTYGYRHPPYGIRAVVSHDQGLTWDTDNVLVVRNDGAGYDLGYPRSMQLRDGAILTLYYFTGDDGVTHPACTRWRLP